MNVNALIIRAIERRKKHLLIFAIIMSVVWFLFLYYYNYRTFSVSDKHLQHELQTSKYLHTENWERVHLRHSYSDEKQSSAKNDSLNLVRDRYHVNEYSRADLAQNNSQFYSILPRILKTVHNDSHIRRTGVDEDSIQQRQYSSFQHGNDAASRLPEWLRRDPLVQQLLSQQNISRSSLNDEFLEELSTTAKPVRRRQKPVSEPVLASGHKLSGYLEVDIRHAADINKRIVVSVVDSGFTNFAVNFQRLSVDRIGLRNFLFMCIDREAVGILQEHGIACSYYRKSSAIQNIVAGKTSKERSTPSAASDFGTVGYFRKSNAKTAVVLDILKLGYEVLIVDADVVLFKNPFPYFNCTSCDVHFQMDRDMYNSGFAFIRPTPASIRLYESAWDLYIKYQKAHDQTYINLAIGRLNGDKRRSPVVRVHSLSPSLFPCGVYYFEHEHRMFENKPACLSCVIAHNNYIGSIAAKIYRFKENLMWTIDEDGYYSNSMARYITYENPTYFGPNTTRFEWEALQSALAIAVATGRILILPSFHCCSGCAEGSRSTCSSPRFRCSLLSVLRIRTFDRIFASKYREHSFLSNSLVPNHIKRNLSVQPVLFNVSAFPEVWHSVNETAVRVVTVANYSRGATLQEVVRWISKYNETAVIRFHSLYGNSIDWESDPRFGRKLKHWFRVALDCSVYEQWDRSMLNLSNLWPGKNAENH